MENPSAVSTKETHNCMYCDYICQSNTGLRNHINRKHELDAPSALQCWTCCKYFSKEELLNQHFKTVLHQIKCRNLQKEEKSEMPPLKTISEVISDHREKKEAKCKRPYKTRLYKKDNFTGTKIRSKRMRKPVEKSNLRTDAAIIPLEEITVQADPRSEPIISWLDLIDEEDSNFPESTKTDISTSETMEMNKIDDSTRELIELFEIPITDVPTTKASTELYADLPQLDLNDELPHAEDTLNFLDYLTDNH